MIENDTKFLCDDSSPKSNGSSPIKSRREENVGWTWLLLLSGISTTIGSAVPIGWTIGVLNTPSEIIKQWIIATITSKYGTVPSSQTMELIWSSLVSIFLIGGMAGSFSGAWVANKVGRKRALLYAAILSLATAVLFVVARPLNSVEAMFVARFVAGLASGLSMTVMPTYVSELAPIELRGIVGILCPLGVTFGVVFAQAIGLPQILGTEAAWHYLLGFYGLLTLVVILLYPILPESPKYLFLLRCSRQEAIKELCRLRNLPEEFVSHELSESNEQAGESWTFARVLADRSLWINISIVCFFNLGQQFSGINAVFYYSVSIFKSAGLSEEISQYSSLASGTVNFVCSMIMIPLINLFPRRCLSITSCSLSTAFLVLLSFSISFTHSASWLSYISIVSVLAYIVMYNLALGPVPYFIGTELFDVGPRPIAVALGTLSNWIGNLAVGLFFPSLQSAIGAYSFLIFAASTALLTLHLKLVMPETNVLIIAKQRRQSLAVPTSEKV